LNTPQIDLQKMLEGQLREQIFGGIEELFKKSRK